MTSLSYQRKPSLTLHPNVQTCCREVYAKFCVANFFSFGDIPGFRVGVRFPPTEERVKAPGWCRLAESPQSGFYSPVKTLAYAVYHVAGLFICFFDMIAAGMSRLWAKSRR